MEFLKAALARGPVPATEGQKIMSPPSPLSALSRGPRSRWRRSGRMRFECTLGQFECERLGQGKSSAAVMR